MVEDTTEPLRCRRCIRVKQGECDDWHLNDDWTWTCPHCLTSIDRGTIADRLRHSAARVRAVGRVQYSEAMSEATRLPITFTRKISALRTIRSLQLLKPFAQNHLLGGGEISRDDGRRR